MACEPTKNKLGVENQPRSNGKRYISLKDLKRPIYVSFEDSANQFLEDILLKSDDRVAESCLKRYLRGQNETVPVSILERLLKNKEADCLEEYVSFLKSGKRGLRMRTENFPLDFGTDSWGFIFGMLPDAGANKYRLVLQSLDLIGAVEDCLNEVGICVEVKEDERGFRIHGGSILGTLLKKSGFIGEKRQVEHNMRFPDWVYEVENCDFHKALVAGIIESEGSAPTGSTRCCRVTQSTSVSIDDFECEVREEKTPTGADVNRAFFSYLSDGKKTIVENSPPPLLLSVKKLLAEYDIQSQLTPESVTMTKRTTAALWYLDIFGEDIKKLYNFCQEYLVSKDETFKEYVQNKEEWHRNKGTRFESYLRDIEHLYEKNGYVTSRMLARYADRAEKTVGNTISILKNKGLVECDGYENRYKCWKPTDKY